MSKLKAQMSNVLLSVIIPAYNEEGNFKKGTLKMVDDYLKKQKYSWEVIVVDDGSGDQTASLLEGFVKNKKTWHLVRNLHQGKAQTVMTGLEKARGQYRLFTDFDQSTPISEVEKFLEKARDFDVVIGSREIRGAKREKEPFYRHLMGKIFNFLVQVLVIKGIYDTQCGFKLFRKEVMKEVLPRLKIAKQKTAGAYTGAFDVELLFLAKKLGFKICEVPIYWKHVRTSRVSPFRDSLKMLSEILKIRFYNLLGAYD